jgi:mannose-1-phosphate guanylyltransferase
MSQATVDRLGDLVSSDQVYVVTGERYAALSAEQLPQIPVENIIVEPSGRNTAPAIGLACIHLRRRDPDAVVAFLHADHAIPGVAQFQKALRRAAEAACAGYIVTLGIEPDSPHTGYGYIRRSVECPDLSANGLPVYTVERFLEKPDHATAEAFLAAGGYYWNGGIFVCRVERMLEEFAHQLPDVMSGLDQIDVALDSNDTKRFAAAWEAIPRISIDHGIMEGAQRVAMVPLDAGWNDVGSWDALEVVRTQDGACNCVAKGDTLVLNSHGNIVYTDKLVALVGVEDLVVVDTGDALLVGSKHQMQKIKDVVEQLQKQGRTDLL